MESVVVIIIGRISNPLDQVDDLQHDLVLDDQQFILNTADHKTP